jgi:MFS family permease
MDVAVLLLTARLAFTMGPSIMLLVHAGPALLLQELGHMFATILLALPLAVLLHMGPSTIGATFSIDREGSFAMVSERYGSGSPQYRGVLTMYIFGTLFGTILVGLIASVTSQLHIFNPLALAMGAGVGSGSMMAAATGAITAEHPNMANEVLAMAATSNVITGLIGVYVGVYVALPLAEKLYNKLAHDNVRPITAEISAAPSGEVEKKPESLVTMPTWVIFVILVVIGIPITAIATKSFTYQLVVGYLLVAALAAAGMALSKLTRNKVPAMVMIVTLGVIISSPISPIAKWVTAMTTPVDFLSICTVVLSIAGLTVGTKLSLLKGLGWKIIPVGLVSVAASYLLSVCVAELALGLWS